MYIFLTIFSRNLAESLIEFKALGSAIFIYYIISSPRLYLKKKLYK